MGTPPPTTNLIKKPVTAKPALTVGVVRSVSSDGTKAVVAVAGAEWTASVPSSVKGVQVGRTVTIRTAGNTRRVEAVTTPVPAQTYATTAAEKRGFTTSAASKTTGAKADLQVPAGSGAVITVSIDPTPPASDDGSAGGYEKTTRNRVRNHEIALRKVVQASNTNGQIVTDLIGAVGDIATAVEQQGTADISTALNKINDQLAETRQVLATLIADLRAQGLTK